MTKSELRKIYLARQRGLISGEQLEKSEQIAVNFFRGFDLKDVRFLHCFLPIEKNREIDTWPIFKKIWRDLPAITTVTSRVDFDKETLETIAVSPETKLVFNRWHILEPPAAAAAGGGVSIEPAKIDLILIPLLAFDRRGFRVGYGKGFYDQFLSTCRLDVKKIGLSYFPPVDEISDVRDFDAKIDFCVTPDRVTAFNY
jgi:5-formyltetrahydrofolate cyclo-ligase